MRLRFAPPSSSVGAERVRVFPSGGHLGNRHRPDVQAAILASFADLSPVAAPAVRSR